MSGKFEDANHEFRAYWEMGRDAARNAAKKINEMVVILHKQNPKWSINHIANTIWVKNEDLEGFSKQTIYNNLNNENRQLIDKRQSHRNNNNNSSSKKS